MRNAYSAGWTSTEVTTHRPPSTGLGAVSLDPGVPGLRITLRAVRTVGHSAAREMGTLMTALMGAFNLESVTDPVYVMDDRVQAQAVQDMAASQPGDPFWDVTVVSGPFRGQLLASTAGQKPATPTNVLIEQWTYLVRPIAGSNAPLDVGALRESMRKMAPPQTMRTVELVTVPAPRKRFAQAGTVFVILGLLGLALFTTRR